MERVFTVGGSIHIYPDDEIKIIGPEQILIRHAEDGSLELLKSNSQLFWRLITEWQAEVKKEQKKGNGT
ncbi:MAG: hypothetical protein ACXABY_07785 [Candidatus Thorarchaeota archaeon]|jgi:hypothetical protein